MKYILIDLEVYQSDVLTVLDRVKYYGSREGNGYGWDNMILGPLCATTTCRNGATIAAYPQDILHGLTTYRIPDFTVLKWDRSSSHSGSMPQARLFFLWEKKTVIYTEQEKDSDVYSKYFYSNLEQVRLQAFHACWQYSVRKVYVFLIIGTYFNLLQYSAPSDFKVWHDLQLTPIYINIPILIGITGAFNPVFLTALRLPFLDDPDIIFQPSWFDPPEATEEVHLPEVSFYVFLWYN